MEIGVEGEWFRGQGRGTRNVGLFRSEECACGVNFLHAIHFKAKCGHETPPKPDPTKPA